jgi:hypothetical protein
MEGILIAVITGIFSLTGIWLNNYLREKKNTQDKQQSIIPSNETKKVREVKKKETVNTKKESPYAVASNERHERSNFFKWPYWWIFILTVLIITLGASFFAKWIINYGLEIFNIESPEIRFSWLALGLGGLAWGIAYIFIGTVDADEFIECWWILLEPYDNLFNSISLGEFILGLLSAIPINFLISWGLAVGLGFLSGTYLNASLSGVVYLAFGIITFISIVWFLSEEPY